MIGLGRFGTSLALNLEAHGHTVLGIDLNPEPVQEIADQIAQAVTLDATSEEALRMVDIASFETVVVAIGADFESNLLTTVSLKEMGVPHVICKAITARQERVLRRVGADRVIRPEHGAGERLAEELSAPAMLEKLPLGSAHSVLELVVPAPLVWQSIGQAQVRQKYGITVLVVKREESLLVSPPPDCVFQQGDILVVLGSNEDVARFSRLS